MARAVFDPAAVCTFCRSHPQRGTRNAAVGPRRGCCIGTPMQIGKAVVAGVGAKLLTGGILGFLVVFAVIYWLL